MPSLFEIEQKMARNIKHYELLRPEVITHEASQDAIEFLIKVMQKDIILLHDELTKTIIENERAKSFLRLTLHQITTLEQSDKSLLAKIKCFLMKDLTS